MTEEHPRRQRLLELDVLRFVAVWLVLGRHSWPPPDDWPGYLRFPIEAWRRGGWVGVDLFFVLSGFLVSGLLFSEFQRNGQIDPLRFYIRRAWKIYPAFYVLILGAVMFSTALTGEIAWPELGAELVFLQSYFVGLWPHTWSLAVEEHFYFLLPPVLVVVLQWRADEKRRRARMALLVGGYAIFALAMRLLNWWTNPEFELLVHLYPSHLRLDALLFGAGIAYLHHFEKARFWKWAKQWRWALLVLGGVLMSPAFFLVLERTPFSFTVGLSAYFVASGCLLIGVMALRMRSSPIVEALAVLGAHSYSIYLWHIPVRTWGITVVENLVGGELPYVARLAIFVVGSLVLGLAMAKAIEVPSLRLRERWYPSRTKNPLVDGSAGR